MRFVAVLFAVLALAAGACGSSGTVTAQSGDRGDSAGESGSSGGGGGAEASGDFCTQLEEMSSEEVSIDEDPEVARAAAQQLRDLGDSAPPDVAKALGVFADLVDTMADLDPEDAEAGMESFGEVMELMFDPEVMLAAATLEAYMVDECGLDPAQAEELFGTDGLTGGALDEPDVSIPEDDQFPDSGGGVSGDLDDDPTDISLDDMAALEEANASASWTQKTSSTGIANDQFISLSTVGGGERAFTATEALEACEAIRLEFEARQPALEIEVLNGETVVAMGSAGVPCTNV